MGSELKKNTAKWHMGLWTSGESEMAAAGQEETRQACRKKQDCTAYPLCTAARHPVLLRIRMVNMQKKKKKHAMPKQTL